MTTRGEALLAIPLENGKAQAMKATLVEKITDAFPYIETSEEIKLLKDKTKKDSNLDEEILKEICKATIIKQTGGKISFWLVRSMLCAHLI